jgi:PucR C-terminal helix-turn-helix domain/GGDEF-like domain
MTPAHRADRTGLVRHSPDLYAHAVASGTTQAADADKELSSLAEALLLRVDELADAVVARVLDAVPYYRGSVEVPEDELLKGIREQLLFVLEPLGQSYDDLDTTTARAIGKRRAVAGVPLATIMDGYRVGIGAVWTAVADEATKRGEISTRSLLRAASDVWLIQDRFTEAMAGGYRDERATQVLAREHERSALVEALIVGRITDTAAMWEAADVLRVSRAGPYTVVAVELLEVGRQVLPGIEERLARSRLESAWRLMPDMQVGIVPLRRADRIGLLVRALQHYPVTRVGISPVFDDLQDTPYALRCARIAMTGALPGRAPIVVFDDSALAIGAVAAPDIMAQVSANVLGGLHRLPNDEGAVLLDTLEAWLDHEGSAASTAEALFCHPNTVRQRLRKLEEKTGRSLKNPRDVTELCVALETARRLPSGG